MQIPEYEYFDIDFNVNQIPAIKKQMNEKVQHS
jgi:hypothetical protein